MENEREGVGGRLFRECIGRRREKREMTMMIVSLLILFTIKIL